MNTLVKPQSARLDREAAYDVIETFLAAEFPGCDADGVAQRLADQLVATNVVHVNAMRPCDRTDEIDFGVALGRTIFLATGSDPEIDRDVVEHFRAEGANVVEAREFLTASDVRYWYTETVDHSMPIVIIDVENARDRAREELMSCFGHVAGAVFTGTERGFGDRIVRVAARAAATCSYDLTR